MVKGAVISPSMNQSVSFYSQLVALENEVEVLIQQGNGASILNENILDINSEQLEKILNKIYAIKKMAARSHLTLIQN